MQTDRLTLIPPDSNGWNMRVAPIAAAPESAKSKRTRANNGPANGNPDENALLYSSRPPRIHRLAHQPDSFTQTSENRFADQEMADIQLHD